MLNAIIKFSLRQPMLIIALSLLVVVVGTREALDLPIDVFPDLNRPRVVIITEAQGYAAEEVERLVNIPLEAVLNGATGVEAVRSSAGEGVSVIFVEFDWATDIYIDRQIVTERLQVAQERLPDDVQPQLAPIASIMGQIMLIGLYIDRDEGRGARDEGREIGERGAGKKRRMHHPRPSPLAPRPLLRAPRCSNCARSPIGKFAAA